ncbi:recombinase XerD [Sphingomonas citri]
MPIVVKNVKVHPSGRVDYRRLYPDALRQFIARPAGLSGPPPREFKRSLGEPKSAGFHTRYEAAAAEFDRIVLKARRELAGAYDPLDAPTIAYLAELFRVQWLEQDERSRWERGVEHSHRVEEGLAWHLSDFKRWAAEGDVEGIVDHWGPAARKVLHDADKLPNPADDDGFARLCIALNSAALGISETLEARLRGAVVDTPPRPLPPKTPAKPQSLRAAVPLLPTFDAYALEASLAPSVRNEWRAALGKLVAFLGHSDAARITADDVVRWKDHCMAQPKPDGGKRAPRTVNNKYLTPLKATLGWAVDQRKLPTNVASGVRVRLPKQAKLREPYFSNEEAGRILAAAVVPAGASISAQSRLARRWVPWLCAYTGARVGEIGQLRKEDVFQLEGHWVLRITPEAGTTKTQEARVVPLHAHLIETGFLDVLRELESGPLFYDPSKRRSDPRETDETRHAKKVGERLAQWVREVVGIDDKGLQPNHAWRHTFKTLAHGIMSEPVSDAITGHAPNTVGRSYGAVPVSAKVDAIARFPRFELPGGDALE